MIDVLDDLRDRLAAVDIAQLMATDSPEGAELMAAPATASADVGGVLDGRVRSYVAPGGKGVVSADGMLTNSVGQMGRALGLDSTLEQLATHFERMAKRPDVEHVYFDNDVRGASVAGLSEAANRIRAIGKPTTTVSRTATSGGLVLAKATDEHLVGEAAQVGNLSVVLPLLDSSEEEASAGRKWRMVSPDDDKGAGFPGSVITDDHLAAFKVNATSSKGVLVDFVAKGEGLDDAGTAALAARIDAFGAKTFVGQEAVDAGLASRVVPSLQHVLDSDHPNQKEPPPMATPDTPTAAPAATDPTPAQVAAVTPEAVAPVVDIAAALADMKASMDAQAAAFEARSKVSDEALAELKASRTETSVDARLNDLVHSGRMLPAEVATQRTIISRLRPDVVEDHFGDLAARTDMSALLMADVSSGGEGVFPVGLRRDMASGTASADLVMEAKIAECRALADGDNEKLAALISAIPSTQENF